MSIYKGDRLIASQGSDIDIDLIRDLHDPDWAKSVLLDHVGLYMDGYTAPSNGMIIGWFKFNNHIAVLDLNVNNITVARATVINSTTNSEGNVQCPVNKGDYIKLENNSQGSIGSNDIDAALYFVPYKAQ